MDEKVNQTHITILALLYNYISNRADSLERQKFDNFEYLIELDLYNEGKPFAISYDEEQQNIYHYSSDKKLFILNNENYFLDEVSKYIYNIPQYILEASLKDYVLKAIDVDRGKINIGTKFEHVNEVRDVYALSYNDALKKAKDCLNSYGYKSIKTHMAYPEQKYCDKSYHVRVSYDVEKIFFDTSLNNKKFVKNTNQTQV